MHKDSLPKHLGGGLRLSALVTTGRPNLGHEIWVGGQSRGARHTRIPFAARYRRYSVANDQLLTYANRHPIERRDSQNRARLLV